MWHHGFHLFPFAFSSENDQKMPRGRRPGVLAREKPPSGRVEINGGIAYHRASRAAPRVRWTEVRNRVALRGLQRAHRLSEGQAGSVEDIRRLAVFLLDPLLRLQPAALIAIGISRRRGQEVRLHLVITR